MSRLSKLFNSPKLFFSDSIAKRTNGSVKPKQATLTFSKKDISEFRASGKPTAVLVGFSDWKTFMKDFLSEHNVVFLGHNPNISEKTSQIILSLPNPTVYCWSYKYPDFLELFCVQNNIKLIHVEDAFIRSFGLGVEKSKPLSLAFDSKAMHFDRALVSDLEQILASYDFSSDVVLMEKAALLHDILRKNAITKYNSVNSGPSLDKIINENSNERILVLGQVEDDLSMKFGAHRIFTGNDLVTMAAIENPTAQILYRPHPESLAVAKKHYSNPQDVAHICDILPKESTLHDCFQIATKVYTVTSLAGFEALLQGLPVKVFGNPFYSGWGATEDVFHIERRSRQLSVLEILAGAYILYPKYYHPVTNAEIDALTAINIIITLKQHAQSKTIIQKKNDFWSNVA